MFKDEIFRECSAGIIAGERSNELSGFPIAYFETRLLGMD
jgi:hypothetical protein